MNSSSPHHDQNQPAWSTMKFLLPTLYCLIALFSMAGSAVAKSSLRAAYQFGSNRAYSAAVELPSRQVIDLGTGRQPIAVNNQGMVLLTDNTNRLIRWRLGIEEVLMECLPEGSWVAINEAGTVVVHPEESTGIKCILFWKPGQATAQLLVWGPSLLGDPLYVQPYALNDCNELVMRIDSESMPTPFPPHVMHSETWTVNLDSSNWTLLARYEYRLETDFSLHQGGKLYTVTDMNNEGLTVGHVHEDLAVTAPFAQDPVYSYQNQYYTRGLAHTLEFEPMQINDSGVILGRNYGPLYGMVILDQFGQRQLGTPLEELSRTSPQMTNPTGKFEEIVMENHYFRRMTERNLSGFPNGRPAPDFYQGTLQELIDSSSPWSRLRAACVSSSGNIAGSGWYQDPATGVTQAKGFLLLPDGLIPDWDRSGSIDNVDRRHGFPGNAWRLWINDDNDQGDLADSYLEDLPQSEHPDHENQAVDGLRDLVDFFPVLLDLQPLLASTPDLSQIFVELRQADGALNFLYSSLHPGEVGRIHKEILNTGFGPDFTAPPQSAQVETIGPDPVRLNPAFLKNIRDEGRGVIFLEGTSESKEPLELVVRQNQVRIFSSRLPLSLSPVRDMFRILNLRTADEKFTGSDPGPWQTSLEDPSNLPDSILAGFSPFLKTLVHVHGYNWSGIEVPAAHAELFKRFYQTGCPARFIGVSWYGDQGKLSLLEASLDFNENVINALVTAPYLARELKDFSGPRTSIFAHSLGNLLASSALLDFEYPAGAFFMVNAAIPNEAFLGERPNRRLLVHPDWKDEGGFPQDYPEHLLAANWHKLFPKEDHRSALAWRNRFHLLPGLTDCTNFYSTAEEVLAHASGELPGLLHDLWEQERVWVYNEMVKGTANLASTLTGDIHGGWGFNHDYMRWYDPGGAAHPPSGSWQRISTAEASLIPETSLSVNPFFRKFSSGDPDFNAWDDGQWLYGDIPAANAKLPGKPYRGSAIDVWRNHAKVLGEAIPGYSNPAGSTPLPTLHLLKNFNMDQLFRELGRWPDRADPEKKNRWLHSDYLNTALPHCHELYFKISQLIKLIP